MSYIERKNDILNMLRTSGGTISHNVLKKKLYVSTSTLRRYLIALENEGIITRHHGGVTLNIPSASEDSISIRRAKNPEKKFAIAKKADSLIKDNMVVFLDSSSTVSYIVPMISRHKNISVITNGINNAVQLYMNENIRCYICPGLVKHKSLSIVGDFATRFLNEFSADIAFLSCKAINASGIYEGDDSQAFCKKAMLENASQKIILCDTTKENASGFVKLSDFSNIDMIISNGRFSDKLCRSIESKGCTIVS